jgi:hypothetical protein
MKTSSSVAGNVSEPRLTLQFGRVRVDQCVSVFRAVKQLQSCDCGRRSIRFVRLALKVVMQNDGDFVDIILL